MSDVERQSGGDKKGRRTKYNAEDRALKEMMCLTKDSFRV